MASENSKRRRGPLPTGKGQLIGVRLQPVQLVGLDEWITSQRIPMTRPEAIRKLMELGHKNQTILVTIRNLVDDVINGQKL
jgi:hypothetical protein